MPKWLKMPGENELRPGARREFVKVMHQHYRDAHRPPLRKIHAKGVEIIETTDGVDGTASRETIRRILLGEVLPQWSTVEVVFLALCDLADKEPGAQVDGDGYYESWTYQDEISKAWNDAVDEPNVVPRQQRAVVDEDPWATTAKPGSRWGSTGYSSDPPF